MSDKEKVMNLEPVHLESSYSDGGFALDFYCRTVGGKRVRIIMKMEFWWIKFIARELWKQINMRRESVESASSAMSESAK